MRERIPFFDRLRMAWQLLVDGEYAAKEATSLDELHNSALVLLAALQREGRFIDFVEQDATVFSNEDIGAAARVVHRGCQKILRQFFSLVPAVKGDEGRPITVPAGFNSDRIRLTGNVRGRPPFQGKLTHHGWIVREVHIPDSMDTADPHIVSPAEIELP